MSASIAGSIPASALVNVIGQSLTGGGNALDLVGLMLSNSNRVPNGFVVVFPNATSVGAYFGLSSVEFTNAQVYFNGYTISTVKPGVLYVANYTMANSSAYLRGGSVASMPLSTLQSIAGLLTVVIDGVSHTSSAINLSAVTSFSDAAQSISNSLGLSGPTQAVVTASIGAAFTGAATASTALVVTSVTGVIHIGDTITGTGIVGTITILAQTLGTTGGAGTYTTSAITSASGAVVATSSVIDVTAVSSGVLQPGALITGAGVTTNTYLNTFGVTVGGVQMTGLGGIGTYSATATQHVVSESMTATTPVVTFDTVSSAFMVISSTTGAASTISYGSGTATGAASVPGLALTQAAGAVTSQGAIPSVPGTFMVGMTNITTDWATFWCAFDPDNGSGNAQKLLFAAWVDSTLNRFAYIADDSDITATEGFPATTSLGYILQQNGSSGTVANYQPTQTYLSAFVSGFVASIDFSATNGRATAAFKGQAGLAVGVTSLSVASSLFRNNYNWYGNYATANSQFQNYYPGQISGAFRWIDSYVNSIWLTNALQLAMMDLLSNSPSIPYNAAGYNKIRLACLDPINAAINFGAITAGVQPSSEQTAIVNASAGIDISTFLRNNGYYLQILDATSQQRAARTSPPMILWYMDGESVQQLTLAAIDVQ